MGDWLLKKIKPCSICVWECCKMTYCHEHNSYDCSKKFWYRMVRLYFFLNDKWWFIKYWFYYKWINN